MRQKNTTAPAGGIQSVERALAILFLVRVSGEAGISELSREMGLPKGTVFGRVKTLEKGGYLEKNPQNQKYRFGLEVLHAGLAFMARLDLHGIFREKAEKLRDELGETILMATLLNKECVMVARSSPQPRLFFTPQIGYSLPPHSNAMGRVLLAWLPEEQLQEILDAGSFERFTTFTLTGADTLRERLALIRKKGYEVVHQEVLMGLSCVAAPVRDYSGKVAASISVAAPYESMRNPAVERKAVEAVTCAAREISRAMGHVEDYVRGR